MAETLYTGTDGGTAKLTLRILDGGEDLVTIQVLERQQTHTMAKRVFESKYRPLTAEELAERFPQGPPPNPWADPDAAPAEGAKEEAVGTKKDATEKGKGAAPKAAKPDTKAATAKAKGKAKAAQENAPTTRQLDKATRIRLFVYPADTFETYASQTGDKAPKVHPARLNEQAATETVYQLRRLADHLADLYNITPAKVEAHLKATTK